MNKTKKILVSVIAVILILVFIIPFFKLYEIIINRPVIGGFGVWSGPSYFEGFFISYSFFVTLALTIFGGRKKYYILAVLLLLIFLIQISVLESLIVSAGAAIVAWLVSHLILLVKRKIAIKK
jgi:hypothetical protein